MTPQPHDIDRRLREGDSAIVGGVSINESHAVLLGVAVGVLAAEADRPRAGLAVVLGAISGDRDGRAIGLRTLRREPWYAAVGVVVGYIIGGYV